MAFGVAKIVGTAAIVTVLVAAAAAASVSMPAATAGEDNADEWQSLTILPAAQGSGTGAWAEPGPAVERLAVRGEPESEPLDAGPRRLTGVAGTDLNAALATAGAPDRVAQDYLRALAT